MAVEFGVLGSIEARIDGRLVDLGPARQRLLLAALLVDLNHEVSADQLAERIWGQEPAQRGTLYAYLSRLRRALAAAQGVEIVRRSAGYVLIADPAGVDLYRFRDLIAQARGATDDERAADLFGQALELWRGEAFATVDTPWGNAVRAEVLQERLVAELDCNEVRLRLGQHSELLAGLRARAGEHPLDEPLAGQLMLALYRCGRAAEALGHYQGIRRQLVNELGVEPGRGLQRLHQQILTVDPALTPRAGARVSTGPAPAAPVPRQLPAPPALFTGRTRELAHLSAAVDGQAPDGPGQAGGTVVISAIGGTGGIGKTYLALHWAHTHLAHFPDGQLYVNLRGFDPSGEPAPPPVVIRGFLTALGVDPAALPDEVEAQAALYRSVVAGRRLLIVLDNARDTAQVTPLLPGSPSCTVLVTSRHQLTGLAITHGVKPLALDALSEAEARQLLTRHLGEARLAAEPEAVSALLEHCAGLPLALGIIAARAATHPGLSLSDLAEELAEAETRLDALDAGELPADLRAVFATSYRALDAAAARAFALLGLAAGPDISLTAAASLLGSTIPRTRALLRLLEAAHLIQQHAPKRYRLHDLVRLYAAEHGRQDLDEPPRTAALRRLVDFYLHTAHHGRPLLEHPPVPVELDPPPPGCAPHRPADAQAARAWFAAEHSCLLAAQQLAAAHGWHTAVWQLPDALYPIHAYQGQVRDGIAMWRTGLAAAEELGDPAPQALAHCRLGHLSALSGQHAAALAHLEDALTRFEQSGDLAGQAHTHHTLVWAWDAHDAPQRALPHGEQALRLYRSVGNTAWETEMLNAVGWDHALLGDYEQARACCEQALPLARTVGDQHTEAGTLDSLGYIAHHTGRHTQALDYYHQSLAVCRDIGHARCEAVCLDHLGDTHHVLGQMAEARHAWQHARDLYRTQHRTADVERVQALLDALGHATAEE